MHSDRERRNSGSADRCHATGRHCTQAVGHQNESGIQDFDCTATDAHDQVPAAHTKRYLIERKLGRGAGTLQNIMFCLSGHVVCPTSARRGAVVETSPGRGGPTMVGAAGGQ